MIWTLASSLLGFGTSFVPKVLDYFQDRQDKAHELRVLAVQSELMRAGHEMRMAEIEMAADIAQAKAVYSHDNTAIRKAPAWVAALSGSVRPVITYSFFGTFAVLHLGTAFGFVPVAVKVAIWTQGVEALFAAIMSFWFGQRAVQKFGGR